jgi:hypothetical protein
MTKFGFVLTFFFLPIIQNQYTGILLPVQNEYRFIYNAYEDLLPSHSDPNHTKADTIPKSSSADIGKKDDAFSRLMAGVVNDTAILFDTYVDVIPKKDTAKKDMSKKTEEKINPQTITVSENKIENDSPIKRAVVTKKIEKGRVHVEKPNQNGLIEKLSERKNDSSVSMVFTDNSKRGKKDTIVIFIPLETTTNVIDRQQADTLKKAADPSSPAKDTAQGIAKEIITSPKIPEKKNLKSISNPPPAENHTGKDSSGNGSKSSQVTPLTNPNCKNMATDYDVDKLRVKMLAIDNDDDRVQVARKLFKMKCFRTIQIRALSEVFSTDEGRYKFLDAAYSFVYDYGNYPQLAGLLTGQYYINRFNAMIRQ